jgi:effector-binding domain-containing protein
MLWAQDQAKNTDVFLYNFTMTPAPTIEEYANEITEVAQIKKFIPKAPFSLLYWTAFIIGKVAKAFGINSSINAERIIKLKQANIIEPTVLQKLNYNYQYNLHTALVDWKNEWPDDWS